MIMKPSHYPESGILKEIYCLSMYTNDIVTTYKEAKNSKDVIIERLKVDNL